MHVGGNPACPGVGVRARGMSRAHAATRAAVASHGAYSSLGSEYLPPKRLFRSRSRSRFLLDSSSYETRRPLVLDVSLVDKCQPELCCLWPDTSSARAACPAGRPGAQPAPRPLSTLHSAIRSALRSRDCPRPRPPHSREAMDDASEDDEGMFVMLGGDGRVFGCGEGIDCSFRAWRGFAPLPCPPPSPPRFPDAPPNLASTHPPVSVDDLVRDSLLVDSPLTEGATFWLGADELDAPRCALEELAGAIFSFHTAPCESDDFDPELSGIEWWVQTRSSLKMHWDKDEEMRVSAGIFVHPHLSTVTYLSCGGDGSKNAAPTVVLEDLTVPTLARHGHSAPADLPSAPRASAVCVSFPEVGKHIAFDGRFLHGVLQEVVPAAEDEGIKAEIGGAESGGKGGEGRRVTFLGNVWLNHRPKGVKPLPEGIVSSLRRPTCMPPATAAPTSPVTVTHLECGKPPRDGVSGVGSAEGWAKPAWYFGWSGDDLKLSGSIPFGRLRSAGIRSIPDTAGAAPEAKTAHTAGAQAHGTSAGTVRLALRPECDVRVVENDHREEGGTGEQQEEDDAREEEKRQRIS